jgi:hypothetical protein
MTLKELQNEMARRYGYPLKKAPGGCHMNAFTRELSRLINVEFSFGCNLVCACEYDDVQDLVGNIRWFGVLDDKRVAERNSVTPRRTEKTALTLPIRLELECTEVHQYGSHRVVKFATTSDPKVTVEMIDDNYLFNPGDKFAGSIGPAK